MRSEDRFMDALAGYVDALLYDKYAADDARKDLVDASREYMRSLIKEDDGHRKG